MADDDHQTLPGPAKAALQLATDETLDGPIAGAAPSVRDTHAYVHGLELPPDARLTPEHPGRYVWLGALGEGGVGVVARVYDQHMGREVALKALKSSGGELELSPGEVRFLDEARITGQLEHPGIVPVYEVGRREDGTLYYCMRKVRGRTLGDAMRAAEMPERLRLLPRFISLCQAVAYAHSRGVIHRDLKPSNVMLGDFGETIVLDWGLAKVRGTPDAGGSPEDSVEQVRAHDTRTGQVLGTPAYMAPEQARGAVETLDSRTDVYALGAILYELATGRVPIIGESATEITERIIAEPVRPPTAFAPDCPREVAAICMRALAKDPDDRYPDAGEMARDLDAFQQGELVSAHTYRARDVLRRWLSRHWRPLVMAAALVAAVIGAWSMRGAQARRDAAEAAAVEQRQVLGEVERILEESRHSGDAGWFDLHTFRLISLKSPAVEARLISALPDRRPAVRRLAARALGGMGSRAAVGALIARLAPDIEPDEGTLIEVIRALGAIGDPAAEQPVFRARQRSKPFSRIWLNTELAYKMIPVAPLGPEDAERFPAWVRRGVALVEKGRWSEALAAYGHALRLKPDSVEVLNNRGITHRRLRDYARALADLDRALELRPGFGHALLSRSVVHRHRGDRGRALADLDQLVAAGGPLTASARRNRARLRWETGDLDGARADLDAALALEPGTRQSLAVDAGYWAAAGDLQRALQQFDAAERADPTDALVYQLRSRVHRQLGDAATAAADLDQAVARDPALPAVLAERATIRRVREGPQAAQADLDRAVQLRPTSADPYAHRAMFHHLPSRDYAGADRDLLRASQRAAPGEKVLLDLLIAVVRRLQRRAAPTLRAAGAIPWHDRLVGVARGRLAAEPLAHRAVTPEMYCALRLAARLGGGPGPPRPGGFAARAPEPADLACAALSALDAAEGR